MTSQELKSIHSGVMLHKTADMPMVKRGLQRPKSRSRGLQEPECHFEPNSNLTARFPASLERKNRSTRGLSTKDVAELRGT